MTIARAGAAVVTYGNKIYVIGGVDGRIFLSSVEMAEVGENGSLSPWRIVSRMPISRGFSSAAVFKKRVYVVGGGNGPYGKNLLRNIVSAPILPSGQLGDWRIETEELLLPRRCSKLFVHQDSLYALGGFGGSLLDNVEVAKINVNGELGEWSLLDNTLTRPRYVNSISKVGGYVFVIGGHHETKGVGIDSVEFTSLRSKPLSWDATHSLNQGRYAFSSISYNDSVYALGGISGNEYLNSVEELNISNGLEEASWQVSTKLPMKMANFMTILVNKKLYILGGSTRQTYQQSVWYSGFNSNGEIGYWGTQIERNEVLKSYNKSDQEVELHNSGVVVDRIDTESYSYMLVNTGIKLIWLAAPSNAIKKDTKIRFSEGVFMSNFYSKSLRKNFEAILFVGAVKEE